MRTVYVELSGESLALGRAELEAVAASCTGQVDPEHGPSNLVVVRFPHDLAVRTLGERLALARRIYRPAPAQGTPEEVARSLRPAGRSAAVRRVGAPTGGADSATRALGAAWVAAGGTVDLERPDVRLWRALGPSGEEVVLEEVYRVERERYGARAMPKLPFRRPVSLAPRLARAAVNLAGVGPGSRVLDPFLGTGALLAEAALLGAEVVGVDRDAAMVRGALRNFRHLGVEPASLVQDDARSPTLVEELGTFDAVVTDPPYGRASGVGGEEPEAVARAVLALWQGAVAEGGSVVVVLPHNSPVLAAPWVEEVRVPVRVHRSLTRAFVRYRRLPR